MKLLMTYDEFKDVSDNMITIKFDDWHIPPLLDDPNYKVTISGDEATVYFQPIQPMDSINVDFTIYAAF